MSKRNYGAIMPHWASKMTLRIDLAAFSAAIYARQQMAHNDSLPKPAAELLERIEREFQGVPRPRITKHVARGLDDEWFLSDERGAELAKLDPEHDWHEVSDEDVQKFNEYFSFSDEEGWRFYLPAYMSYYLRNYSDRYMNPVQFAYRYSPERLALLTPAQKRCVEEFVALSESE